MRTPLSQIVDFNSIGKEKQVAKDAILSLAEKDGKIAENETGERVLFLGIDMQNDFMEGGSLGVPNSILDMENTLVFLYDNLDKITDIYLSLDAHSEKQIFHPLWWKDDQGNQPDPYTIITSEDVASAKWLPQYYPEESALYLEELEKLGKKQLCIWPNHCIEGSFGHNLEGQLENFTYYFEAVKNTKVKKIFKGQDKLSEMYGIFRPEVGGPDTVNESLLKDVMAYDKIILAGQAKSHCVLETVGQMIEYFQGDKKHLSKLYILEDCTSSIPGFIDNTEVTFQEWVADYDINLVTSKTIKL